MRFTALTLETITESATYAVEFAFLPKRPLPYRPGQGGLIIVPGGSAKPFTFASGNRTGRISIATTLHSGSRFKRALADLRAGDRVHAAGAIGTLPSPDPGESQVFVAQGIGITPFLAMARSHGSVNATLLQVGTPHFFDEVAAATRGNAEHHDHRQSLRQAVCRTIASRPAARWFLSGRPDFVAAVATQLAGAGVPARMIHKDKFWGMRTTAPRHDLAAPDQWQAWSGRLSGGLGHGRFLPDSGQQDERGLPAQSASTPSSGHSGPGHGARDSQAERNRP